MRERRSPSSWPIEHPVAITTVLTVFGYAFVAASFLHLVPFPTLGESAVVFFSDAIAVVNSAALVTILAGWRFIKRGYRRRHAAAMSTAFVLILLFLILYTWKQSGGFTKSLVIAEGHFLASFGTPITYAYWVMLGIHVVLSIVAVPFVLHAVVLGATRPIEELGDTAHPTVGRIAVLTWTVSLSLGIVTYWMLNHVYAWEPVGASAALLAFGIPRYEP